MTELYLKRLEDKIVAVRTAASDCVRAIWPHLSEERVERTLKKLLVMASEDPRSEVRAIALRSLPTTEESIEVIMERSGDYDTIVRAAALQRLSEMDASLFTIDSVHLLAKNAYTAALNYEASASKEEEQDDDPQPLQESEVPSFPFSAASRRRKEETALYNVLMILLREAGDNIWEFLDWFPLGENPQAVLFILSTLFSRNFAFPTDFTTREMVEPLDAHKNIAVAVSFCERLAKTPRGSREIEALVPEPVAVCDELDAEKGSPNSSKIFLLLRLAKFLDYSDESGRSEMERQLLALLRRKPQAHIVKLILSNLRRVQNIVQIYTKEVVEAIVDKWIDLTEDFENSDEEAHQSPFFGALSVTLELLATLPSDLTEFGALARIEDDILAPAKKRITESQDPALQALYIKNLAHLGKWVARTREDNFDDLCFWTTNPKKSPPLRAAALTTLVDWFLLTPNITLPAGSLDAEGLANAILKIINDTPLNAPLTFAAVAGLMRLVFSNKITSESIISNFMLASFLKMTLDRRLRHLLASFFPTWASYPDARPIICGAFLHFIRHTPDDIPAPQRKMIWKFSLRLLFENARLEEMGEYNFVVAKKCLKTVYADTDRSTDTFDILKELDFIGISDSERDQLDRMLGKVTNKIPSTLPAANKILAKMKQSTSQATARKRNSLGNLKFPNSWKFPEPPPQKVPKQAKAERESSNVNNNTSDGNSRTSAKGGRLSLDSEAHKRLLAKSKGKSSSDDDIIDEDARKNPAKRKRGRLEIKMVGTKSNDESEEDDGDNGEEETVTDTQVARASHMSQLRREYVDLDDFEIKTVSETKKRGSASSAASTRTPTKNSSSTKTSAANSKKSDSTAATLRTPEAKNAKKSKVAPMTAPPASKRRKLAELDESKDEDDGLTDADTLLKQLELKLGTDAVALQKIRDLSKIVSTNSPKTSETSKRGSKSKVVDPDEEEEEEENVQKTTPSRRLLPRRTASKMAEELSRVQTMELDDEDDEPPVSRAKRGRNATRNDEISENEDEISKNAGEISKFSSKNKSAVSPAPSASPSVSAGKILRSKITSTPFKSNTKVPTSPNNLSDAEAGIEEEVEDFDDSELAPPSKKLKHREVESSNTSKANSSRSTSRGAQKDESKEEVEISSSQRPIRASSRTVSSSQMSSNDGSAQSKTKGNSAFVAGEDSSADWKKMHLPPLAARSGPKVIGFLGYGAHEAQLKSFQKKLSSLGFATKEIVGFDKKDQVSHLVIRSGAVEPSRTASCYAVFGTWIMNEKWVDAIIKKGGWVAEEKFGTRVNKKIIFEGQSVFFSPKLASNASLKRIAQSIVKECDAKVTINGAKADCILATMYDDISFLREEFEDLPIISVTKLLTDVNKAV